MYLETKQVPAFSPPPPQWCLQVGPGNGVAELVPAKSPSRTALAGQRGSRPRLETSSARVGMETRSAVRARVVQGEHLPMSDPTPGQTMADVTSRPPGASTHRRRHVSFHAQSPGRFEGGRGWCFFAQSVLFERFSKRPAKARVMEVQSFPLPPTALAASPRRHCWGKPISKSFEC